MKVHFSELFEEKDDHFIAKKDIRLGAALIKNKTSLSSSDTPFDFKSIASHYIEIHEENNVIQIIRVLPNDT